MEYCYRLMTEQYRYGFDPGWRYLSGIDDEGLAIRGVRGVLHYAEICEAALWSCSDDGRVNLICAWTKGESGEPKSVALDRLEFAEDLTATKETFDHRRPRLGDEEAWLTSPWNQELI
jgi:hypothetical protein